MSRRVVVLDDSPKIPQELIQKLSEGLLQRDSVPEDSGWITALEPLQHKPSVFTIVPHPVSCLYPSKEPRSTPLRELRDTPTQIELLRKADEKRTRKNKKRLEGK